MKEQILKIIDEEISNLQYEMKHLDRQYVEKQKRLRELRRSRKQALQINDKQE